MTNFILGFLIGVIVEFIVLLVIAKQVQKRRDKEILKGDNTMLINLWVKDKKDGSIHQVGTYSHDSIEYLDGEVVYVNMQSSASTLDDYEWVEPPDLDDYVSVTPDQLYLNRELIHKDVIAMLRKEMSHENT